MSKIFFWTANIEDERKKWKLKEKMSLCQMDFLNELKEIPFTEKSYSTTSQWKCKSKLFDFMTNDVECKGIKLFVLWDEFSWEFSRT